MSKEDVRHIRAYLRDYKYYQQKIKEYNLKIEQLEYEMSGVKGVSFDHESGGGYQSGAKSDRFYQLAEKLDEVSAERSIAIQHVTEIQRICEESSEPWLMTEAFIGGRRLTDIAKEISKKEGWLCYEQYVSMKITRAIEQMLRDETIK